MTFSLFALVGCKNTPGFEIVFDYVQGEKDGHFLRLLREAKKLNSTLMRSPLSLVLGGLVMTL
jgi:hypothetical protein